MKLMKSPSLTFHSHRRISHHCCHYPSHLRLSRHHFRSMHSSMPFFSAALPEHDSHFTSKVDDWRVDVCGSPQPASSFSYHPFPLESVGCVQANIAEQPTTSSSSVTSSSRRPAPLYEKAGYRQLVLKLAGIFVENGKSFTNVFPAAISAQIQPLLTAMTVYSSSPDATFEEINDSLRSSEGIQASQGTQGSQGSADEIGALLIPAEQAITKADEIDAQPEVETPWQSFWDDRFYDHLKGTQCSVRV